MGHRRKLNQQALRDSSGCASFSLCYDAKVRFPSFKQVFLSKFLEAGKDGRVKASFGVFCLLTTSLKLTPKHIWGSKSCVPQLQPHNGCVAADINGFKTLVIAGGTEV